jgi:CBS domain-containing protein
MKSLEPTHGMRPVGDEAVSEDMANNLELVARSFVTVLVTARNSADRAAWARTIHDRSARCEGPFATVCGHPIPPANRVVCREDVDRWFERAAGGTLFIDHVGALSSDAQHRLSWLLAEQSRDRSATATPYRDGHVRIISATDRSLRADLAVGAFSDVLFYRLNLISIDLRHHLDGELMNVTDLMSTPPHTCRPDTDLGTIAQMMWDHDCGFVPVIDVSGKVAGVITDRDICIATATRHLLPERISAQQAMTGPVRACMADDSVSDALAAMKEFQVRRLPVVDASGRLQAVITMNDIALSSDQKRKPTPGDVVSTLAAICAHRTAATLTT